MKIVWTENAIRRIEDIASHISENSPRASQKWKGLIYQKTRRLRTHPKMGRRVPETDRDEIREIFHGNYRIVYRIESNHISILTVRHGKQLLPRSEISEK
ncbi:MAG: type II toxin-antitoxin system RelE/ParE family toxin [bacterium]